MPILHTRTDGSDHTNQSTYIVVFTILGVIGFGAITTLFVKFVARRVVNSRRAHELGPTFVLVNGVTRTRRDTIHDEKTRIEKELIQANAYSRDISKDEPAIFLREVTPTPVHPSAMSPEEILGEMPIPGGNQSRSNPPQPGHGLFGFALRAASAASRASRSSVGASSYRTANTRFSRGSMTPSGAEFGAVRTVQQVFSPVLPDELSLPQIGEHLTLVESFDDGWCLVIRETMKDDQGMLDSAAMAIFAPPKRSHDEENSKEDLVLGENVGYVPAWCFLKAAPGLKPQRPMRCSSLPASAVQL